VRSILPLHSVSKVNAQGTITVVIRTAKLVVVLLVVAGAGLAVRPWIEQQMGSRARTAYFEQGKAYAPRVLEDVAPLPPELREASGLAVSRTQPGVIWSHNDSGDAPMLYALDLTGRLLAKVALLNTVATDWEDIALGPCPGITTAVSPCLYIADTGNNSQARDIVTVFVVAEPSIGGVDPSRPISVDPQSFRFRYPNLHEDTEAIAVLPNGDVTVVTKGRTPTIAFFGFSKADVARAMTLHEVLTAVFEGDTGIAPDQNLGRWVTGAAMSPDGMTLAVRTYSEIFFYAVERGPQGRRWRDLKRPCFLGEVEPQGEAIDFLDATTLIIGSETSQGRPGVMHRVRC
jgi:hypothetical protein